MNFFASAPAETITQVYLHLLKPLSTLLTLFALWVAMNSIGCNSFASPRQQLHMTLLLNMKTRSLPNFILIGLEGISLTGFSVCSRETLYVLLQGKLPAHPLRGIMIMVTQFALNLKGSL